MLYIVKRATRGKKKVYMNREEKVLREVFLEKVIFRSKHKVSELPWGREKRRQRCFRSQNVHVQMPRAKRLWPVRFTQSWTTSNAPRTFLQNSSYTNYITTLSFCLPHLSVFLISAKNVNPSNLSKPLVTWPKLPVLCVPSNLSIAL